MDNCFYPIVPKTETEESCCFFIWGEIARRKVRLGFFCFVAFFN